MSLLTVDKLQVAFRGNDPVVKEVSFSIHQGEMLAIVGESGSGKSVTALSLMQLHDPERVEYPAGSIVFEGQELLGLPESSLRRLRGQAMSIIFQEPMSALNPLHTIGKQIAEAIRIHQPIGEAAILARVQELLEVVGLHKLTNRLRAYPHELSGGERQRVMIAMALANRPQLLIADEPTTALDVTLQEQIIALLKDLQRQLNLAILLITHDLTLVRHAADHVAIMHQGLIVEQGPTAQIFAQPTHSYTQHLLASEPHGHAVPVTPSAPVLLKAEQLSVRYGVKKGLFRASSGVLALSPTNLHIRRGETVGIVGESGSGKTTLGLALLRLIPSQGDITFQDTPLQGLAYAQLQPLRRKLQFVFQDPFSSLNPRMTIGQIIAEGLTIHEPMLSDAEREAKVTDILQEVGLEASMRNRYPHEFSGGQRQRINIARAMILQPELVVLDEPTSALDLSLQAQILALLKEFQQRRGTSYLFISHDLRVIRTIAHRVIVMRQGAIVEEALTEVIFNRPQQAYTRQLLQAAYMKNGGNAAGEASFGIDNEDR